MLKYHLKLYFNVFQVFQNHCKLEYHINATLDAEHFINVLEKKEKSIIEQLDSDRFLLYWQLLKLMRFQL